MSSVRPPLTRYLSSLSRTDFRATTETSWSAPREYDVVKGAGVKSGALEADRGRRLVGVGGGLGDGEREGDVLGELLLDQLLVVREVEDDWQSAAFQASFGSMFDAVWQVDISGVNIDMPLTLDAWPSASPLVVYSSEETCGW
jgi:hypothetical protein